jgi:hypothetical protein
MNQLTQQVDEDLVDNQPTCQAEEYIQETGQLRGIQSTLLRLNDLLLSIHHTQPIGGMSD